MLQFHQLLFSASNEDFSLKGFRLGLVAPTSDTSGTRSMKEPLACDKRILLNTKVRAHHDRFEFLRTSRLRTGGTLTKE